MSPAEPENAARRPVDVAEALVADTATTRAGVDWNADRAVTAIYSEHYRPLVRLAALLVGDYATAEEVVQDSFVAMHGSWRRLRDTDKALSYLQQFVVSRSRSVLRRRMVVDKNTPKQPADMPSAEQAAILNLERSQVVAALRELPERQRQAIVLRYYGDLSEAQIASAMGISRGAVKSHTARGMSALRASMEDTAETSGDRLRRESHTVADSITPSPGGLEVIRGRTGQERSGHMPGGNESIPGQSSPGGIGPSTRQEEVESGSRRYLVGEFPGRVRGGAEFSLIVSINSGAPEHEASTAPLPDLDVGPGGVPITFVIRPDRGLLACGELQQTVLMPQHGDSPPVRFAFRARAIGLSRIRVTSWLGGTFLAELRLEVSVESDTPMADSQRHGTPVSTLEADPGEVTLQVHYDGAQYSFQLLSQRYLFGPVLAKSLTEKPGQAVERTVAMLRKMAREASGYTAPLAARWVRETGIGLWQDLVPRSVQDQFWQLRDSITSFTIACDDDTVPWELLYPLAPGADAGFLVEQFPVLRRVYDQRRSQRVWLGNARYIVPPDSPTNAHDEVATIRRILAQPSSSPIADLASLLDLLDVGVTGMLHFACHNTFSTEAGGSSIEMADGKFVPQLLNSAVARRCLASCSPLIFVNACRSAGVSAEYTQMMGWASQFMAAGAGAFIGTLWPVRSSQASCFAEAFYSALVAGANLGKATVSARQATKDDGDPTWLAYSTYGDPAAFGAFAA